MVVVVAARPINSIPYWKVILMKIQVKERETVEKELTSIYETCFWDDSDPLLELEGLAPKRGQPARPNDSIDLSEDSFILAFCGRRGAGKSETMTATALKAQYMWNMRLIANYPIKYRLNRVDGISEIIEAEPLDMYRLLCFDNDYRNCLILLDEAPDIISHMASMTWKNRLLNIWVRQLRKNRSSLFVASQNFELLDKGFRWQTDIIVNCTDAFKKYHSPGVVRGACILLQLLDNSGLWKGETWQQELKRKEAHGDYSPLGERGVCYPTILWGDKDHEAVYDTYRVQDVFESLKRVDLHLGQYEVGQGSPRDTMSPVLERAANAIVDIQKQSDGKRRGIFSRDFYESLGPLTEKEKKFVARKLSGADVPTGINNGRKYFDFSKFDVERLLT